MVRWRNWIDAGNGGEVSHRQVTLTGELRAVLNTLKRAKVLPYGLEKTSYRFESCSDP